MKLIITVKCLPESESPEQLYKLVENVQDHFESLRQSNMLGHHSKATLRYLVGHEGKVVPRNPIIDIEPNSPAPIADESTPTAIRPDPKPDLPSID
jgi:hypothetical protein